MPFLSYVFYIYQYTYYFKLEQRKDFIQSEFEFALFTSGQPLNRACRRKAMEHWYEFL